MGVAFDGVNAIWYLLAGDLVNAGFSAMAFLPIIGDAAGAGKLLQNAASKIGSQASELFAKYGDNVVKCVDDILGFAKKEGVEVALPDGGSIKLWGDSAGNTLQFASKNNSNISGAVSSLWTPTANKNNLWNKGKLKEHYEKHGISEFGAKSFKEYSDMAYQFGKKESDSIIQVIEGAYIYEPSTNNIFVGTAKGGKIKSFYKWDGREDHVIETLKRLGEL